MCYLWKQTLNHVILSSLLENNSWANITYVLERGFIAKWSVWQG